MSHQYFSWLTYLKLTILSPRYTTRWDELLMVK
ncbi:DUF4113 domain-containing protein [Gilliamella sp. B3464]|nr:DUF4113 domain-containing protein [Gilliamella sp. B3468]MCX8727036.1 DUF4113 domain-containing protein [Gilliamella sp. B2838]MCX8751093.1 DUF4113 domain-containing protein [Gilliamella sp. B3464]